MSGKKPNALEKFYFKQQQEFRQYDRDCAVKHMTRSAYEEYSEFFKLHGITEQRTAYGLSRGNRGVLLHCLKWRSLCWVIFLD